MSANANPIFARQAPLGLNVPNHVAVVGCGGVGSWAALFLALAGVPLLTLYDHDTIDFPNLNRLPMGRDFLNHAKATALAVTIERITHTHCIPVVARWEPQEVHQDLLPNWLLCATDTHRSRLSAYEWCAPRKVSYIECSAEGEFGGMAGSPATLITPDEENPGYATVPVHVGPCVMAASMAAYHILHNTSHPGLNYRIGWEHSQLQLQNLSDAPAKEQAEPAA